MILSGFERPGGRRLGGIKALWLTESCNVESVDFSGGRHICSALMLTAGTEWARYDFAEGTGFYEETLPVGSVSPGIIHELSFCLPGMGAASAASLSEISEASRGGMIALAESEAGEMLLIGYSRLFGSERPLRLTSCFADTAVARQEHPARKFVLTCRDTSPAPVYTGPRPQ